MPYSTDPVYHKRLINAVPGFVTIVDEDFRYLMVNDLLCRQLGIPENDLIGKHLGHRGDSRLRDLIAEFSKNSEAHTQDQIQFQINGEPRWYFLFVSRIPEKKQYMICSIDIHDRIVAEKKSREQESIVAVSGQFAAIGQFAAGIAHEIKNPLAVISARCFTLKNRLQATADEKVMDAIEKIESTVFRISKIIKALGAMSRGTSSEDMGWIQAHTLVEDVMVLVEEKKKDNGITVILDVSENQQICVKPTLFAQVLLNLIGNSVDAIRAKPDLEERWIRVAAKESSDDFEWEIIDSAGPIPEEVAERMMQPHFTSKPSGQGTGLGLTLSRKILKEMGGDIFFERLPETKFTLRWPKP